MTAQGITSGFAFLRNPIVLRQEFDGADVADVKGGAFSLVLGDRKIYDGRFFPPLDMNIAEMVEAASSYFPEASGPEALSVVEDAEAFERRRVYASFDFRDQTAEYECMAIPGGVSKQNLRTYHGAGTDAFEARFLNYSANFFLTTRTGGWLVDIRETELCPLYFICCPTGAQVLIVTERAGGHSLEFDLIERGVMALDPAALRRRFVLEHNVLPSVLDVAVAGKFACRLAITQGDLSAERYRLKFRNSLGVYEILELCGEISLTPSAEAEDEGIYRRHEALTDDFSSGRDRVEQGLRLSMETLVPESRRVPFLLDMLASEEVWLLDGFSSPLRVIPSADNLEYDLRSRRPLKFNLRLDAVDADRCSLPEISDSDSASRQGIFTKEFDQFFN